MIIIRVGVNIRSHSPLDLSSIDDTQSHLIQIKRKLTLAQALPLNGQTNLHL